MAAWFDAIKPSPAFISYHYEIEPSHLDIDAYLAPQSDVNLGHAAGSERGSCVVAAELPDKRLGQRWILLQVLQLLGVFK